MPSLSRADNSRIQQSPVRLLTRDHLQLLAIHPHLALPFTNHALLLLYILSSSSSIFLPSCSRRDAKRETEAFSTSGKRAIRIGAEREFFFVMATLEESQSPRSPEARLGMKVEDLWDFQQGAQLSPTEKLNACFEGIPLSAFPASPSSQGNFLAISNLDRSLPDSVLRVCGFHGRRSKSSIL